MPWAASAEEPKPEPLTLCAGVGRVDGVAAEVDEKEPLPWTLVLMELVVTTDAFPDSGSDVIGENWEGLCGV